MRTASAVVVPANLALAVADRRQRDRPVLALDVGQQVSTEDQRFRREGAGLPVDERAFLLAGRQF
ncbi:MAG TPA: hypothetical protein VH682_16285 [Gemmataceae bacterium]|jgi:hypothetical protein